MQRFSYAAKLERDEDGGFVVTFPDVPEAISQGETVAEALREGADALEEAIAGRIRLKKPIPRSGPARRGQYAVTLPIEMAMKAALYIAMGEAGLSNTQLAARLGLDEKEVRRLLSPAHPSKLPRIEAALAALGKRLEVVVREAGEAA